MNRTVLVLFVQLLCSFCAASMLILCSSCAHFLQLLCSFCSTYRTTWRNLCGASYLNPSLYPCLPHVIVVDSLSRCNNPKGVPNICSKRRKGGLDEHKSSCTVAGCLVRMEDMAVTS